jgi:hypothetical protein
MNATDQASHLQFDSEASQLLRQAGHAAGNRRVTAEDLRRVLTEPIHTQWPPTKLH